MRRRAVIIGAGIGGLTAAIRLAHNDYEVTVVESRPAAGGLASGFEIDGLHFDAGPYILLDRPGLDWAFQRLCINPTDYFQLHRISGVYQVDDGSAELISIDDSLETTAEGFDARWPGAGERYRRFINKSIATYQRLQSLQWQSRPGLLDVIRCGAWRDVPFILRSLGSVLNTARLPPPVIQALGIWSHVAGQSANAAPSPLALVTSVMHRIGAYYPTGGIATIAKVLFDVAVKAGVEFRFGTSVQRIGCENRTVTGVKLHTETLPADIVISNAGLATYTTLLDDVGHAALTGRRRRYFDRLSLQSPGICAYLAVRGQTEPPYLRFRLNDEPDGCRLLITPGVIDKSLERDGWHPARLVAPMAQSRADAGGEKGQREFLNRIVESEAWWRETFSDVRVLRTRIPCEWGSHFSLHRNSMNPVMTSRFMLTGRIAHQSPWIRNLYVAGSATHPGQWVSFCAVSGIHAADRVLTDAGIQS
ncbi:MAG: NAD(P)/FAD-dependent oxidoreductase [Fuerstiella sp.]|jgi:phytoene desaturase|nr:NAD(P)/FAD-dependent oxidoreductase [Fuerstiella sp.]